LIPSRSSTIKITLWPSAGMQHGGKRLTGSGDEGVGEPSRPLLTDGDLMAKGCCGYRDAARATVIDSGSFSRSLPGVNLSDSFGLPYAQRRLLTQRRPHLARHAHRGVGDLDLACELLR
jgi:hypothetical protein